VTENQLAKALGWLKCYFLHIQVHQRYLCKTNMVWSTTNYNVMKLTMLFISSPN